MSNSFSKNLIAYNNEAVLNIENTAAFLGISTATVRNWVKCGHLETFGKDATYLRTNLGDEAFVTLGINLMVYTNSSGEVVFQKTVDLTSRQEIPITVDIQSFIDKRSRITKQSGYISQPLSGFILLDKGPMLLSSKPILKSDNSGPVRGSLIFGRYLDANEIDRVSQLVGYPIDIFPVSGNNLPEDVQSAVNSLSGGAAIITQPLSYQYTAGYTTLKDIDGNPILLLRVNVPRNLFQAGQTSIFTLVLSILGIALLIGIAIFAFLQRGLLSRLSQIVRSINHIRETGDTATPVSVGGADELTTVADTLNNMLASLRSSYQQLQESEGKYRLITDNATDVIITADLRFNTTYISPSIQHLTGYNSEEIMSQPLMNLLTPPSQAYASNILQEELSAESSPQSDPARIRILELEIKRQDGSLLWAEASTTFLRNAAGKATGILTVIHDITERKETQEKLQALYKQESETRKRLEEELERRIQFTRALVHELKTPITPVLVSSELLLEEVKEGPLLRIARNISDGATHLSRRIDELVDMARAEIGTVEIKKDHFEAAPFLEEIYANMKPVADRGKQNLQMEMPESLGTVYADRERIRQGMRNRLNNSLSTN